MARLFADGALVRSGTPIDHLLAIGYAISEASCDETKLTGGLGQQGFKLILD